MSFNPKLSAELELEHLILKIMTHRLRDLIKLSKSCYKYYDTNEIYRLLFKLNELKNKNNELLSEQIHYYNEKSIEPNEESKQLFKNLFKHELQEFVEDERFIKYINNKDELTKLRNSI